MAVIVVTAPYEGGLYSPDRNRWAPIRIYSDRYVRDDCLSPPRKYRERLSRREFRRVRKAAAQNRAEGFV